MSSTKSSQQEVQRKLKEFATSGLTRREYSEHHGIPLTTMDYWRRVANRKPRLAEVKVVDNKKVETEASSGFTITLANGRRIECLAPFADSQLSRLIRIVESA